MASSWSGRALEQPPGGHLHPPRRRKTARERREQQHRAIARHMGFLVKMANTLQHRGSAPTNGLRTMLESGFTSQPTASKPTTPCWHYPHGTCRYGDNCKYLHVSTAAEPVGNAGDGVQPASASSKHGVTNYTPAYRAAAASLEKSVLADPTHVTTAPSATSAAPNVASARATTDTVAAILGGEQMATLESARGTAIVNASEVASHDSHANEWHISSESDGLARTNLTVRFSFDHVPSTVHVSDAILVSEILEIAADCTNLPYDTDFCVAIDDHYLDVSARYSLLATFARNNCLTLCLSLRDPSALPNIVWRVADPERLDLFDGMTIHTHDADH